MNNHELEAYFSIKPDILYASVSGDGHHYQLTLVSDIFIGKTPLARQRWVYSQLKDLIISGSLHALSMKTWTKAEWEKKNG